MQVIWKLDKYSIKYISFVFLAGILAITLVVLNGAEIKIRAKDFEVLIVPKNGDSQLFYPLKENKCLTK